MISSILSRLVILLFGTLYPAYASYKAVKTKHFKEYVKWMMYWIVFALFTSIETFTDVFLSWFPFYYEIKIILVIWLLSPATNGSSFLYRKFVHPMLSSKEQEIDEYLAKAKEQSYKQVLDLGSKGVSALMQTAIKGGGGLVNQLKKSYSLSDLSEQLEEHDQTDNRLVVVRRRRPNNPLDETVTSASTTSVYFGEVDIRTEPIVTHIQSAEDISSGYSSGEGLYKVKGSSTNLVRSGSLTRTRTTRVTRSSVVNRKSTGSDDSLDSNIIYLNDQVKKITDLPGDPEIFYDTIADTNNGGNMHVNKKCSPELTTSSDACESNVVVRRGGRYNKCIAPPPPIKATLVLQAGLVKSVPSLTSPDETKCKKEVFVAIKRKSKNFLNIPNILNIGHRNKIVKRSSWHGCGDLLTPNSKIQSKSTNELCE